MEARLNQLNTQIEDNASRSDVMSIHMKNVKQELSHTQVSWILPLESTFERKLTKRQGVYDAKCRQVDTEDHFKQLADRECGRLTVEIRRLEKETGEISDHVTFCACR